LLTESGGENSASCVDGFAKALFSDGRDLALVPNPLPSLNSAGLIGSVSERFEGVPPTIERLLSGPTLCLPVGFVGLADVSFTLSVVRCADEVLLEETPIRESREGVRLTVGDGIDASSSIVI
jgi:hypothetical protein